MTISFDMRQFNATLTKLAKEADKAGLEVINQKAYDVAVTAAHATKVADKQEIARILGQTGNALNYTKKGQLRKGKAARGKSIISNDSFGARIVNARRREHAGADFMLWGHSLEEAVRKLIRARQNAVGFIASGFVRAARQLRRFARFKARETPKGIVIVQTGPSGKGTPATPSSGSVFKATIATDVVTGGGKFQAKGTFNPQPIAEAALRAGFDEAQARMEASLARRMGEAAKTAGAL